VKVAPDIAMTGELTLMGEVLAIGGVREKVIAAQRLGIKQVLLPSENRRDVEELKGDVVKGVRFCYVDVFADVFDVLFKTGRKSRKSRRN
jgi:ATP-dependent Lon protease